MPNPVLSALMSLPSYDLSQFGLQAVKSDRPCHCEAFSRNSCVFLVTTLIKRTININFHLTSFIWVIIHMNNPCIATGQQGTVQAAAETFIVVL